MVVGMYFFHKKSPSGTSLQLLESFRNGDGKPRTRVVVSLGDASHSQDLLAAVAREVEDRLYDRPGLFPASHQVREMADRIVSLIEARGIWQPLGTVASTAAPGQAQAAPAVLAEPTATVLVDQVGTESSKSLGPELVALQAWRDLGMDPLLAEKGFNPAQIQAACMQVVGRLVSPGSEYALQNLVLPGSALPELLGDSSAPTPTSLDRLYRVADKLIDNRDAIETHLRRRTESLLGLTRTYYLYDLTNSHFEGICASNPKAKRGCSKQKRNDCPLITAGVCFDEYGFILFHRTFAGNVGEASTLPDIITQMRKCVESEPENLFAAQPTVLLDGGLATEKNLQLLRDAGINYLVNRTRSFRGHFEAIFAQAETFSAVPGRAADLEVLVRIAPAGDDANPSPAPASDTVVLCRSTSRGEKETAIRSNAEKRLIKDLTKLAARVDKGRLKTADKIHAAIGRLCERHGRAARYWQIELLDDKLVYQRRSDVAQDQGLDGCYVLQASNFSGQAAAVIWRQYMVLEKAEAGFRAIKHGCGMRPNFHHVEGRVDSHIFISILAYQLMQYTCFKLTAAGDRRCWQTIRNILQSHQCVTVRMPCADGSIRFIRRPGRPDGGQRAIYQALGIDLDAVPIRKWQQEAPPSEKL